MACKQSENKPIFIVGSYRSGTSVLTWCLGQHPNILPLPETHWIAKLTIGMQGLFEAGTVNGRYSHLGALGWNRKDFYSAFGRSVDQFIIDTREPRLRFILSESAKKYGLNDFKIEALEERWKNNLIQGKEGNKNFQIMRHPSDPKCRWVDGTPENSFHMYGLSMLFPEAKFIHILRNPNEVARSLMKFSQAGDAGWDYSEAQAYTAWQRATESVVKGEFALGNGKVLRISYEDLVKEPEKTLHKCLTFVGEEFSADCLLPLREKINSSKIDSGKMVLPNPASVKGKLANRFYDSIRNESPPSVIDIEALKDLADQFQEFVQAANTNSRTMVFKVLRKLNRLLKSIRNRQIK